MNLDVRTIMIVLSTLNLVFSGLLSLAALHAGNIQGMKHWAIGSLVIGIGLGFGNFQFDPGINQWIIVIVASLVSLGIGLQFNGIQVFKNGYCFSALPWVLVIWIFLCDTWFTVIHPDIKIRVIANSLFFAICNAACARSLCIRIDPPLKTAYWFTGIGFFILAIAFVLRAISVYLAPAAGFTIYSSLPVNPLIYFVGCISEMCITFGFVLMLNYRMAVNLEKLALIDALTGAMNRRNLEQEASRLTARCLRTSDSLALMMIDIDHFKLINDLYGHLAGDAVLVKLSEVVRKTIRSDDYFARYGGEEFCILLPSTLKHEAWILAERLRQTFEETPVIFDGEGIRSSISIGVTDSKESGLEFGKLLAVADQALYQAKQQGRNRVVASGGDGNADSMRMQAISSV